MRLDNYKKILFFIFIIGCTDEPNQSTFIVSIKNISGNPFTVQAFKNNTTVFQEKIGVGQNGKSCSYIDENFRGIFVNYCGIDSLVIKFNNTRGYISTNNNLGDFNFTNLRNPLLPNGGFNVNSNLYDFLVTQEDVENAFELPE